MPYQDFVPGGRIWMFQEFDAGPTLGRIKRPVYNDRDVPDAVATLEPYDFQVKLSRAGVQTFNLLPLSLWMLQPYGLLPLIVQDTSGGASVSAKTIVPGGTDTINGLAQWQIIADYGSVVLRPKSDRTGWIAS